MTMSDHKKVLLEWTFPEFHEHNRGTWWYFWMTLLGGGLILSSLFVGNFLFALIIILVALLAVLYERRGPRRATFQITGEGIVFDQEFFQYGDVKNFRIVYTPPEVKNLYLTFTSLLRPRITIHLENQDPSRVRKILSQYILEDFESEGEPIADILTRNLKL